MVRVSRIKRRLLFTGWIKWTVLPVIPFCVLFFDVWLNIQVRVNGYESSTLNKEQRDLEAAMNVEVSRMAQLRGVNDISSKAEQMGLSAPEVNQFYTVAYREIKSVIPLMQTDIFETAQVAPTITTIKLTGTDTAAETVSPPFDGSGAGLSLALAQNTTETAVLATETGAASANNAQGALLEQASSSTPEDPDLDLLTEEDMLTAL